MMIIILKNLAPLSVKTSSRDLGTQRCLGEGASAPRQGAGSKVCCRTFSGQLPAYTEELQRRLAAVPPYTHSYQADRAVRYQRDFCQNNCQFDAAPIGRNQSDACDYEFPDWLRRIARLCETAVLTDDTFVPSFQR